MKYRGNIEYKLSIGGKEIRNVCVISLTNHSFFAQSDEGEIRLTWRKAFNVDKLFVVQINLEYMQEVALRLCKDPLIGKRLKEACRAMEAGTAEEYAQAKEILEGCGQSQAIQCLAGLCAYLQGNHRQAVDNWCAAGMIKFAARMAWEHQYLRLCQELVGALIEQGSDHLVELFEELIWQNDAADGLAELLEISYSFPEETENFLTDMACNVLKEKGIPFERNDIDGLCAALQACYDGRQIVDLIQELPDHVTTVVQSKPAPDGEDTQPKSADTGEPEIVPEKPGSHEICRDGQSERAPEPKGTLTKNEPAKLVKPVERKVYPANRIVEIVSRRGDEKVDAYFCGTLLRRSTDVCIPVEEGKTITLELGARSIAEQGLYPVYRAMNEREAQADANREYDIIFRLGINRSNSKAAIFEAEFSSEERARCGVSNWLANDDCISMSVCTEREIADALLRTCPQLSEILVKESKTAQVDSGVQLQRQYDQLVQGRLSVSREEAARIVTKKLAALVSEKAALKDIANALLLLLTYDCEEALKQAVDYKLVFDKRIGEMHPNQQSNPAYKQPHELVKQLAVLLTKPQKITEKQFSSKLGFLIRKVAGERYVTDAMNALRERDVQQ